MSGPIVAVFGASASLPGDGHYEEGVRCGSLLAEAGITVATGGYAGVMEAVSKGAASSGGHVIGVTVPSEFPERPGANQWVVEEIQSPNLTERIHALTAMSAGSISLHGSLGTLTELMVAWNLAFVAQLRSVRPKPVVAVGPRWLPIVEELTGLVETAPGLVSCVDSVEEAVTEITRQVTGSG